MDIDQKLAEVRQNIQMLKDNHVDDLVVDVLKNLTAIVTAIADRQA